jgi:hypothetical protein
MFERALCAGRPTEWWYPERQGKTPQELSQIFIHMKIAINMCRQCPEITKCLRHSIENNEVGIWGGMGEKMRKRARRMMNLGIPIEDVIEQLVTGARR